MKTSNESIQALTKLLNTLGRRLMKKYYGLDVSFDVVDMIENDANYRYPYYLVITDPKLPNVLDVKTQEYFEWGKYATVQDVEYLLSSLMKYIGGALDEVRIDIKNKSRNSFYEDIHNIDEMAYLNYPEKFLELPEVGAVLEKDTGFVYSLYEDDIIDIDSGNHLAHIDEEDFWENLTNITKQNLTRIYK